MTEQMTARGVRVSTVGSTIDGLVVFGRHNPAAVIVASDADGLTPEEFVRAIRRHANPFVIAVLDPCEEGGRAGGIPGGNAAIERPYDAVDVWGLLAETQGALRATEPLRVGPLELDPVAYSVKADGRRLHDLPLKEFELLRSLLEHAPEVLPDVHVWHELWGEEPLNANALAVHVARLRHRLEGVAWIRRIRGLGYVLTVD